MLLSGGVGGARMARALAAVMTPANLTVVVNVGDDDTVFGVHVAADLDTVVYTLAGIEGPHGWGRRDDTFLVMDELGTLGADTSFRLGDRDLALCLRRTEALVSGRALSDVTDELRLAHGVETAVLPATDDRVRTRVQVDGERWLDFQDYFVRRRHRDPVRALEYEGAVDASPAPGVVAAIERADLVVIAPSNPPLSIHPILAIEPIRRAVAGASRVVAVSPFFGGAALKGPAAEVMTNLGYAPGNAGLLEAYEGLLTDLIVDIGDDADVAALARPGVRIVAMDTRIGDPTAGAAFGRRFLSAIASDGSNGEA